MSVVCLLCSSLTSKTNKEEVGHSTQEDGQAAHDADAVGQAHGVIDLLGQTITDVVLVVPQLVINDGFGTVLEGRNVLDPSEPFELGIVVGHEATKKNQGHDEKGTNCHRELGTLEH